MIPGIYDGVVVYERNGEHVLEIPEDMDSLKWKNWMKKPGGKFSKDFLAWIREKGEAKYFMIKSENMQTVIRLIDSDEDELLHYESLGLLNGKLKDSYYMHLKTVGIDQNIRGNERYIGKGAKNMPVSQLEDENKELENDEQSYHSESLFN